MLVLERFVAPEATDLGTDLSDVPEKAVWCGADAGLATKIKPGYTDSVVPMIMDWR